MSIETTINKVKAIVSLRKDKKRILDMFQGLKFSPRYHSYRFSNEDMANVSSFTNKLTPPFNPEMANIVARSKGGKGLPSNPEYYTQRWAFKRDEAANRGSRVHLYAEQYPILDNAEDALEEGVCNFYDYMEAEGYEVVCMELRMTDGKLAGTCDLLLRHKVTGKYVIADWKTNAKDIKEVKHYHKPLQVFTDVLGTDIGKFTVQLSMYKYLLEEKGVEIDELWVIHLSEDLYDDNFEVIKLDALDVKSEMEEGRELQIMLEDFRVELREKKIAREAKFNNKNKY